MRPVSLFILAALCGVGGSACSQGQTPILPIVEAKSEETTLFQLINQARIDNGIEPLRWNEALARYARSYAAHMLANNTFGHADPVKTTLGNRVREAGITLTLVSENLAMAADVEGLHREIMLSESHRRSLLYGGYKETGVGIARVPPGLRYTPFGQPVPAGYLVAVELFLMP